MDDERDGSYSRTPDVEDVIKICQSLNSQGVDYILIGGFAVIAHGAVRTTKDIDFLVDPSVTNLKKIKEALSILPDNAIALIKDDDVEKNTVVRVADEVVVDLMAKACGISYEEAHQDIEWINIDDVRIPVASKELLIRLKNTYRPQDQMDVTFLKDLIAEKKA